MNTERQERLKPSLRRGFTLLELLTVIAIIGILSSTVIAALSAARQKSRDARRIAQIHEFTRAFELYYDAHQSYPSTTPTGFSGDDAGLQALVSSNYFSQSPTPPPGIDATYIYHGVYDFGGVPAECDGAAPAYTACSSFELGITLERSENEILQKDDDQTVGTFYGGGAECTNNVAGDEACYDVAP